MAKITVVCENSAGPVPGILGEHGFSVLIEREGTTLLFDTGQGKSILNNLECLQKNPGRVGSIALSHGHYDHTGGLKQVLQQCGKVDVFCHPGVFSERFAAIKTGGRTTYRSAGIPFQRAELEGLGARFVFNTAWSEIGPGVYLCGEVPRATDFEKDDQRLKVRAHDGYKQDTIVDDQCLVLESAQGLVVILGCAHSGLINTLNYITAQLSGKSIHIIIGGTHMGFLDEAQVEETIKHLHHISFEKIGVSHCTGLAPAMRLMQAFGDRFFFANAGSTLTVQ
jgi:7,8-dihydropterin-6-yl-methyl-4-(beta-D-ribofuranosyl)aminobenzene 5'-phosphate synthase